MFSINLTGLPFSLMLPPNPGVATRKSSTEGENNSQLSINYHDYSAFCLNYHSIIVQPLLDVLYSTKSTFVLNIFALL